MARATAEILSPEDVVFEKELAELVASAKQIGVSYGRLVKELLDFSEKFRALNELALKLDRTEQATRRRDKLFRVLQDAVSSANPSIWSRWNTIAEQASKLRKYANVLPPYRDSLYEVARAMKSKPKAVEGWIEREAITPDSSVNEIKRLRAGSKVSPKAKSKTAAKKLGNLASITLYFEDYDAAFRFLTVVMIQHPDFNVRMDRELDTRFRTLSEQEYGKAKTRFV